MLSWKERKELTEKEVYMHARRTKIMNISVQPEMYERINDYCSTRGCTRSWFIVKAAEMFLNACLEDKADYDAAVAAWAEFEKGGFKSASAASVFEKAGI